MLGLGSLLGLNMCREFIILIISDVFNNLLIVNSKVELMLKIC
jgi:hypothetical protein